MLHTKSIAAAALAALFIALGRTSVQAQALWSLSLDDPNQAVQAGTAGTIIFTGAIDNLDSSLVLNFFGDSISTGNWDPTLNVVEDPSFLSFLNSPGFLDPGTSYVGALIDLSYTSLTPPAFAPPYDGTFQVNTDGIYSSLSVPFTLSVEPQVGGSTPEPGSLALIASFAVICAGAGIGFRHRRRNA
jgi:hypothetical protein